MANTIKIMVTPAFYEEDTQEELIGYFNKALKQRGKEFDLRETLYQFPSIEKARSALQTMIRISDKFWYPVHGGKPVPMNLDIDDHTGKVYQGSRRQDESNEEVLFIEISDKNQRESVTKAIPQESPSLGKRHQTGEPDLTDMIRGLL